MKIILSFFVVAHACVAAINFDFSTNLIGNYSDVRFNGGNSSVVLDDYLNGGNDQFRIYGFGDRVQFSSPSTKDWYFEKQTFYRWEFQYTSDINDPSTYLTMTATAEAKHNSNALYQLHVLKYRKGNNDMFRVVAAYGAVIPEPSTYVFILGLAALVYVMWKRRNAK